MFPKIGPLPQPLPWSLLGGRGCAFCCFCPPLHQTSLFCPACHRTKVCTTKGVSTQGRAQLTSPWSDHCDVGSFINTVCTLNKGFVFVLFLFFLSSLRELKVFICRFLCCIFCTITVYSMSFCIKCIRVWGCKWNFIHILSKYLL